MKHFVLSIALSALVILAVSASTQAAYYHHYWHHMATLSPPIGTTIALTGGAEVTARLQLVSTAPTE